jgi:hypothetical protein
VRARVTELRQTVAQSAVARASIDREFVLRTLTDNALKAKELQEFSASNRALELLGREMGMFHTQFELGNITSLEDVPQHLMDQIILLLEKAAEEQQRKQLGAGGCGPTIDVKPTHSSETT